MQRKPRFKAGVTTETGAGTVKTALFMACSYLDLDRKAMMHASA